MLKTILVPVDGSDSCLVAVDYAIELSRIFDAELVGVSIIDIKRLAGPFMRDLGTSIGGMVPYADFQRKIRQILEEMAIAALDEFEGKCKSAKVSFIREKREGIVSKEIVSAAKRCDMISMGMAGEHALWRDALLGSNLESVARQTHKPILVAPGKYKKISKMLIAYDGSAFSNKALATGATIAQKAGIPITVIHVSDDKAGGEIVLSQAVGSLKDYNVTYDTVIEGGEPAQAIVDVGKKGNYDLMVMGAYGHSRLRELVLGSSTVQIMRNVNCPLVLCR
ncbi:MAG: universal stress protein [Candidatus Scalindua sp. AMX11]|nr:MAG: universal stress protein [Candidatus Scalindua sp.]NOG82730.1 universal stress protein [Planctomycetota bacterium]RZV95299.1 MAG: universal stress protein [Candidatus Scalindua sp. SCAELEC01]TDE66218.1 MAG: universal stress protein [Candidatus Scalindua sp. AMX11]GJQ57839.1 MAG: universal stress protein UspA [Candidatus Scalindua sp.]